MIGSNLTGHDMTSNKIGGIDILSIIVNYIFRHPSCNMTVTNLFLLWQSRNISSKRPQRHEKFANNGSTLRTKETHAMLKDTTLKSLICTQHWVVLCLSYNETCKINLS